MPLRQWLFVAVMTVVVGAIGSKELIWQPTQPPHDPTYNNSISSAADQKGDKDSPPESWWEPFVADHVAFATILLAGVTGVLAISTTVLCFITAWGMNQQSRDTQRSIAVAERALTELERPFAFVEVINSGIGPGPMCRFTMSVNGEQFKFRVVNHGRTPAFLIERLTFWIIEAGTTVQAYPIDPDTQRPGLAFPAGCIASKRAPL